MKKYVAFLLFLAILFLSGCSETPYETEESSLQGVLDSPVSRIDRYESYQYFLSNGLGVPEGFVTFDCISVFGQWNSFIFDCLVPSGNYGICYRYNLKMPAIDGTIEQEISIYHQPEKAFVQRFMKEHMKKEPTKSKLSDADFENYESMYQIEPRKNHFYIERNGVTYLYLNQGVLLNVFWELDGLLYDIIVDNELISNLDKTSVLGRLLSLDEDIAKEAYNEIKASLTK